MSAIPFNFTRPRAVEFTCDLERMSKAEIERGRGEILIAAHRLAMDWPGLHFKEFRPGTWGLSCGVGIEVHQVDPSLVESVVRGEAFRQRLRDQRG